MEPTGTWRCAVCRKVKDLKGPHLNGKTTVRSDCWPCAKKTTFVLDAAGAAASLKPNAAPEQSPGPSVPAVAESRVGAAADAKAAASSPFKSAFGAPAPAADAKAPASSPFKSAFGPPAVAGDAKAPASSPFKSAFGAPAPAADAKAPASSPFKSAFGAPAAAADAKAPASSPFKSAFGVAGGASSGTASTDSLSKSAFTRGGESPDSKVAESSAPAVPAPVPGPKSGSAVAAAPNGDGVWRCAACHKVKDLKGPHLDGKTSVRSDCWPCAKKTTFVRDGSSPSSDTGKPATASPAAPPVATSTSVAQSEGSAVVFHPPVVPSAEDEAKYLLPTETVAEAAKPALLPATEPAASGDAAWRCAVCRKVKDLKGPHLNGKTTVRSDCWPCAKKTTFVLDAAGAASSLKPDAALEQSTELSVPAVAESRVGAAADAKAAASSPFKSAFGAPAPAADAKAPASSPFKSAFGAPAPAADAKAPASSPFKSAFGAPAPAADSKAPASSAFKSAFGAPAAAADAKAPASSPFKSAFGAPAPAADSKAPASSLFESAFGAPAVAADAKAPASSPFKSAFGAPAVAADAKAPASSPFKSAFGAPAAAADAKAPASSPFKSAFGAPAVAADAKAPASSPFKSAFGAPAPAADAKAPASSPFKSALGAPAAAADAKAPASSPFKSAFGVAGGASSGTASTDSLSKSAFTRGGESPDSKVAESSAPAVPAPVPGPKSGSAVAAAPNGDGVWRCAACHKVKDLKGPHLDGKTSVRSDCWPCAKKTTFVRDGSSPGSDTGKPVTASPATPPVATSTSVAQSEGSAVVFHPPVVPSAENEAKYLLPTETVAEAAKPALLPATEPAASGDAAWRCAVCRKVKDLKGPHLNGKTTVRSDCWPCAKKTTFVLDAAGAASSLKPDAAPEQSTKLSVPAVAEGRVGAAAGAAADAKVPASSPFKSAFGAPAPAADAKAPASSPFKSVFGAPAAAADAKAPASSPFKSAFGAPAPAADAKAPVSSVFKSAFAPAAAVASEKVSAIPLQHNRGGVGASPNEAESPAASAADRDTMDSMRLGDDEESEYYEDYIDGSSGSSAWSDDDESCSSSGAQEEQDGASTPTGLNSKSQLPSQPAKSSSGAAVEAEKKDSVSAAAPAFGATGSFGFNAKPFGAPGPKKEGIPDGAFGAGFATEMALVPVMRSEKPGAKVGAQSSVSSPADAANTEVEAAPLAAKDGAAAQVSCVHGDGNEVVDLAAPTKEAATTAVQTIPDFSLQQFSLQEVQRVVLDALAEQRESMKAEWEVFREELLYDVRKAVAEASTRNILAERADFDAAVDETDAAIVRRHLSKAFRKL